MKKLAIVSAAVLTAGTFGLAAMAQEVSVGDDFFKYDGNKDGMITFEEARGAFPTLTDVVFNQADANGDGSLDEAEFTALIGLTAGAGNTSEDPANSGGDDSTDDGDDDDDDASSQPL